MAQDERRGEDAPYTEASDGRLTALLRGETPIAYAALRELRERHHPSVLAYARLCTASETAARELGAEVFTVAARQTARGNEPSVPWRHQLLLLTARLSGIPSAEGPPPPMLPAFECLPPRDQGLIWYGVVENESDDRTALLLGLVPQDVQFKRELAVLALRRASLRLRLAASEDPRCQDFRRLIEESVRPDNPRHSTDLHNHMAHCAHCTGAYDELRALRDHPRAALAEGLLPWGGTTYAREEASGPSEECGPTETTETCEAPARPTTKAKAPAIAEGESWTDDAAEAGTGATAGAAAAGAGAARAGTETQHPKGQGQIEEALLRPAEARTGVPAETPEGGHIRTAAGTRGVAPKDSWDEPGPAVGVGAAGAGSRADVVALAEGAADEERPGSRRLVLTLVALGVALAPLLFLLVFSNHEDPSQNAAGSVGTPTAPPTTGKAPAAPASPTPSDAASSTEMSPKPSKPSKPPKESPKPPKESPKPPKETPGRSDRAPAPSLPNGPLPNGSYAQVVNVGSGLCLDIRGELGLGTDVVTATCSSRDTQRWRFDSHRNVLQSFVDPDLCLDSRGKTDQGVGVWRCDAVESENGENLRFTIDPLGQIRPDIAPDLAVTPGALGAVAFAEAKEEDGQRWRAGGKPRR